MPTKTRQDATLYAGKDYEVTFSEIDDEDLSNFNKITYVFADSEYGGSTHFTKTKSGGGISVSGGSNQDAVVSINGSDTDSLEAPKTYYHELETEDGAGDEQVAAEGTVTLKPSRTN